MNAKQLLVASLVIGAVGFAGVKGYSAWSKRITPAKIAAGKALFEHDWAVNDTLCGEGDGLGPVFNETSCVACHFQGGIGGASGNAHNVLAFEIESDQKLEFDAGVIHANSTHRAYAESEVLVRNMFAKMQRRNEALREQAKATEPEPLPLPPSDMPSCDYVPPSMTVQPRDEIVIHHLNSPALWGVGLIDRMSSISISFHGKKRIASRISNEMSGDFTGNRIGILPSNGGVAGKFGWKGQFGSLEGFIASACAMEIGLTNHMFSQVEARKFKSDEAAKMDMTREQLHELVCFVRSLPRPEQILPTEERELKDVVRGKEVFAQVGCNDCHVEDLGGIEGIYSDFHLYNLELVKPQVGASGDRYGDGKAEQEFDFDNEGPHPDQWQTPPLWGVADSAPYFHDGGSPTLRMAINRHLGQAAHSQQEFATLSTKDQNCLIKFLKTLKAPQIPATDEEPEFK